MAIRNIRKNEDPILRKKCREVKKIDAHTLEILNDMEETMYASEGIGLAANQVGILRRLVLVDSGEVLYKLINPRIVKSDGSCDALEGCLSFPGVWGKVPRPERVTVCALNEKGEEITVTGEGRTASCLCHEIDHLDGIVFTDKVTEYVDE
jgi:peptide deformylase